MRYRHAVVQTATASFCIGLLLLLSTGASPARAGESVSPRTEAEAEQSDVFYDAMIRSIELDRNRWKSFGRSMESGPWFYDTQGLVRSGRQVTARVAVYPHPERTELYASVYGDHTKIRKIDFVTEIDCSRHTYRQPEIRVYGYNRELLIEHVRQGKELAFSPIRPGTTTDTLRTLVCPPGVKKK